MVDNYNSYPLDRMSVAVFVVRKSTFALVMAYFPHFIDPIATTLLCDCGTFMLVQLTEGSDRRSSNWAEVARTASWALRARNLEARGRILLNFSTARKVTTSAGWKVGFLAGSAVPAGEGRRLATDSARSAITSTSVNVSARAASRRKAAFL